MPARPKYSSAQLIIRSLRPSAASTFWCLLIAALLVGVNVVLRSVSTGTALPGVLDGQWAVSYTENIVQPLTELLSNNILNKLLVAMLWGVAGFVVYIGFEYGLHWLRDWRESRTNIRMARGNVIERPLTENFWRAALWRTGVLLAGIIFLIAVQPLLRDALEATQGAVVSENLLQDGLQLLFAVLEWAVVLHGLVVFLRLYTMRTRLFGDSGLY